MTYIKPQVLIHQEFVQQTASNESTLRAMIIGPNAILHRYGNANEKQDIALGEYEQGTDTNYLYPNRSAGGIVDNAYSKLYADNALLSYYNRLDQANIEEGDDDNASVKIYALSSNPNIVHTDIHLVANGEDSPRAAALGSRDVQVGDYVWLHSFDGTGAAPDAACEHTYFTSKIVGFAPEVDTPSPNADTAVTATKSNFLTDQAATPASAGENSTLTLTATTYDGVASGQLNVTYTITVKNILHTVNCDSSVWLQIECASTGEDYLVEVFSDTVFDIGAYGIKGKFTAQNFTALTASDSWTVSAAAAYAAPTLTISGTYTGAFDDTYVVEVVSGGTIANSTNCPVIVIRNASNTEVIKGIKVKDSSAHAYGSNGLSFAFTEQDELAKGQRYTFAVEAGVNTDVTALILQDDLPTDMRSASVDAKVALDMRLMTRQDSLLITAENAATPAQDNFTQTSTQVTIAGNIALYVDGFTSALDLVSGDLFFEYREWSPIAANELNYCASVSDLDLIPGQLDPDNPLKYGVYKALSASNGVSVAYAAVTNPEVLDAWQDAVSAAEGASDIYKLVPMSTDIRVANMVQTLVNAESGYAACRWKSAAYAFEMPTTRMLVGKNEVNNTRMETSSNGASVFAQFTQNQNEAGAPYTRLSITSGNASFVDYGVRPGDTIKIIGAGYGATFTVDTVLSSGTVITTTSGESLHDTQVEIEVWHDMTKTEQATYYGQLAGAMTSRRNCVIYPTVVGEGGVELPGYYIAAEIAGLSSGINAYQSMTRAEVTGFDDFSRVKPYFTESQLDILAACGVFIVMEDSSGTPFVRHALTTDMSTTAKQEEVITRDYDYICKTIYAVLDSYIGKASITKKFIQKLELEVSYALEGLIASGHLNSYSNLFVEPDALLADRITVGLTINLPFPVNNIEVFVYADKGL